MTQPGTVVLNLGPSAGNPRNSEGAFLDLKDGRILFAYSRYIGDSVATASPCCIAVKYSNDYGDTWSEDEVVVESGNYGIVNAMSVSLMRMLDGQIGLFYLIRRARNDVRLHISRSSDEGKTWSEAQCVIPGLGYYITNNDRVVRLSTGRLVVPAAYHKMSGETTEYDELKSKNDSRAIAHFFLSDDDGRSWREAQSYCALQAPRSKTGLQEPGVVELNNGALWAWARTDLGCQYEMFSHDGGESWTQAAPSPFISPCSPLSMKRWPRYDCLLAVWNPIPKYQTRRIAPYTSGRTPLIGAISRDEGRTWVDAFSLETEEGRGGYCYTAIHFVEDTVLLAYCAGMPEDRSPLARLKIRKVKLSEITS